MINGKESTFNNLFSIKYTNFCFLFYFTIASGLKCYVGIGTASTSTDCPSSLDVCVKSTISGYPPGFSCGLKSALTTYGHSGDGCMTIQSSEFCLCNTNDCNNPNQNEETTTSGENHRTA